jgi:hypothetical protein
MFYRPKKNVSETPPVTAERTQEKDQEKSHQQKPQEKVYQPKKRKSLGLDPRSKKMGKGVILPVGLTPL